MKPILTLAFALLAGQAQALSCLFGDAAAAYNQARGYDGTVRAAIGRLDWGDRRARDVLLMRYEGQEFEQPLQFHGAIVGEGGPRTPIDMPVTLETSCINGDCGYAGDGEVLTFLHEINQGLVMYAYPCQSYPRGAVPEAVALVQRCVDGNPCEGSFEY